MKILENWHKTGGVFLISYDMFTQSTAGDDSKKKKTQDIKLTQKLMALLSTPGAHVVVCDEGHMIKNDKSLRQQRIYAVGTKRRIILTGTPLQNNLNECKPLSIHFFRLTAI